MLYSPNSIAVLFAVSPATVRNWLRSGRMTAQKVGPRLWRVQQEDLISFCKTYDCKIPIDSLV